MIYNMVSAAVAPGKEQEAIGLLQKLLTHVRENYQRTIQIEILRSLDGPVLLHWVGKYESLAAFEEESGRWDADPRVAELWQGADGDALFEDIENHFYRVL